jgi:MFS family permease
VEALDDAIPVYPVYPLLFADNGQSTGEISILYTVWTVASLALNIPAGALADRVSRRALLVAGGLCRAVAFGAWTFAPSFLGFAVGFVLWGAGGALISGAFEALIYDELAAVGVTDGYGRLIGRAGTLKLVSSAAAAALAIPLLALGGYRLVGVASVGVCLVWSVAARTLPVRPRTEQLGNYWATLTDGLRAAAAHPAVRGAVVLAALAPGLAVVDEYAPLLGPAYHQSRASVPVFLLGLTLTSAVANWCAARWSHTRRVAGVLAVAALAFGVSAAVPNLFGFAFIAAGWGLLSFTIVVTGVRLQHAIEGTARATVTSVADVGSDVVAMAAYALFGAASGLLSVTSLIAAFAVPVLLLAAAARRWLPTTQP